MATDPTTVMLFVHELGGSYRRATPQEVLASAGKAARALFRRGSSIQNPSDSAAYLRTKLRGSEREIFCCLFLDQKHRVLGFEKLFFGSISEAKVYPREVVKSALKRNAAAVILCHNHPSGDAKPSAADREVTARLKAALAVVDVRVLDHIVIGDGDHRSMAELGQL
jgi:DNA repair protein RadC